MSEIAGVSRLLKEQPWWSVLLRGLLAIVFGILVFTWPVATVAVFVFFFAAFMFADGVFALISAIKHKPEQGGRGWLIFQGITGVLAGIVAVIWPAITTLVMLVLVALWAIITGVMEIMAAVKLHRGAASKWLLVISGILSLLFGIAAIVKPQVGILAILWLVGAYAIASGVVLIALGFMLMITQRKKANAA